MIYPSTTCDVDQSLNSQVVNVIKKFCHNWRGCRQFHVTRMGVVLSTQHTFAEAFV